MKKALSFSFQAQTFLSSLQMTEMTFLKQISWPFPISVLPAIIIV